ncbi:DegV family protein [Romboutsia sp.]|uniref:DegV family protein n=1 Tax=Romboutsia sp. TaxID=1965302 RepID=UPI002BE088C8|nr:DegV family protein [Romboutsia sp.]HSQ89383.1 DegV family protein [Romboutsia sp.]
MSRIKIITDSSCDLNKDIVQKYNIEIVGLNVSFGEETYIDGEMNNDIFYKRMAEYKDLPKTSCPSPEKFAKSYEGIEDIIVLTLSSKLSATYSTAVLAKNMVLEENPNKRIEVIDTQTGSVGQGILVAKAAQLAQEGKSLSEIVEIIEKIKNNIVFFGSLETLENAIKGGRINPLAGKLINALNFKIIIQVIDGLVKPVDKARGDNNCLKKVVENVCSRITKDEKKVLAIGHSNCLQKALKVKEMMLEKHKFEDITISEVGSVMGTYTSKGAILISVL